MNKNSIEGYVISRIEAGQIFYLNKQFNWQTNDSKGPHVHTKAVIQQILNTISQGGWGGAELPEIFYEASWNKHTGTELLSEPQALEFLQTKIQSKPVLKLV